MRAYRDRISEILHTPYRTGDAENELQPHQVELDSDAKQVWQMFHDKVEEQLSEYGTLSTVRGFGNKAPEHGLRSSIRCWLDFMLQRLATLAGLAAGTYEIQLFSFNTI